MNLPVITLAALLAALSMLGTTAHAQTPRQDIATIRKVVSDFLRVQSSGLPGQVSITVGQIDTRTNLAACAAPEAFLPGGSRVWGKTTIGVRCTTPSPWTIYVSATVQVLAEYVITATPLAQGQTIGPNDVARIKGDLTTLPTGIITDTTQAVGRTAITSLTAGMPLRTDALRVQQAVQQGQTIRLVSNGPGFRVSTEAKALNNAAEGQVAQARTNSGQVVSGVARAGGVVEVTY